MSTKCIHISLPDELSGYVERQIKGGRYQDASDVVRDALRQMETTELASDLEQFNQAFAGGKDRAETADDIRRVENAIKAVRKE